MASDANGRGLRPWGIWALGGIGFGLAFFMRVSPSAMVGDLMRDFAVGAAVLGNLSAIYFYVYAGLQIPIGTLMDRWGPRLMIASSVAVSGLGAVLFGVAPTVEIAYLGRALVGGGSACAFVGSLILVGRWFPPNRFAFLSGLTMFVGMAGGIVGQGPLAVLLTVTDWRTTMFGAAAFAAALSAAVWLVVRDHPDEANAAARANTARNANLLGNVAAAMRIAPVWIIGGVAASMSGLLLAFGGLWGVPYLMVRFGIGRPDAAFFTSFNLIGWALGAPLCGWFSDRIERRKAPLLAAAIVTLASLVALFFGGFGLAVSTALIFLVGLSSGCMILCFALARENTPHSIHGSVTGFINTGTVGAGALLQPIIGLLLDWQWDGTIVEGVRVYSAGAYEIAFLSLVAWSAMGVACALAVRETYCRAVMPDR